MDEAKAKNHQSVLPSVDWLAYYTSIADQCPWSLRAYVRGKIDVQKWAPGEPVPPLLELEARVWLVDYSEEEIQSVAQELDSQDAACEWLFSYPGYGRWATPVPVLIQQNRAQLNRIRNAQSAEK